MWLDEENFQVLKRCYIQAYPTSFFFCYGKAVNLLPMWNLDWSSSVVVLVKGAAELNLEDGRMDSDIKRGIPKFGTVFTQTGATYDENT